MPASIKPEPVPVTDEQIVWSVTGTNNDAAVLECQYGDYHGRVVRYFGIPGSGDENKWSGVVNHGNGRSGFDNEDGAKQHCEAVIRADIEARFAAVYETLRLYGDLPACPT